MDVKPAEDIGSTSSTRLLDAAIFKNQLKKIRVSNMETHLSRIERGKKLDDLIHDFQNLCFLQSQVERVRRHNIKINFAKFLGLARILLVSEDAPETKGPLH